MSAINYVLVFIVLCCTFLLATAETSNFRILAPEIVCPKDENAVIERPDNTVITLQTEISDLRFSWTVRWALLDTPTQRFILLLWRSVRALETQLNGPQPDPFIFVINNTQLLGGVDYIFNVTSISESSESSIKSFHIDNVKGDKKLIVDGRSDKFSLFLVGGVKVYTDIQYILVAEVTTCSPIQDYYFTWHVKGTSGTLVNVADITGFRLEIPPYSLGVGEYSVTCQAFRNTSLITQTDLPFHVLNRGLKVYLNVDVLLVTVDSAFTLEAIVENRDYYNETPTFEWICMYQEDILDSFENSDNEILTISTGLHEIGEYEMKLVVTVLGQQESAKAVISVVEPSLPIIQVQPVRRLVSEGSKVSLIANVSNVSPSCTLTWYFATEEYLASMEEADKCGDCKHGQALSDSVTVFSLEENFLTEITDFTNETEWRQVTAEMEALQGRARFVAQCGCSLTFSCKTEGVVYADISFQLNSGPKVEDVKISPETGTAMETVFRIIRLSASDPDKPLLYTLLCSLGNDEPALVLGSNLEYLALDMFLPYVGTTGTDIWAEVCDSVGACTKSAVRTIMLAAGESRSVELLTENMRGHVMRCEMMMLNVVALSAIITYSNAGQDEALATFTKHLLDSLPAGDEHCLKSYQEYWTMLHWLAGHGVDTSDLMQ